MKLLSDRIQEFFDWLEENTEFGDWDEKFKIEIQKKLIEIMTDNTKEQND